MMRSKHAARIAVMALGVVALVACNSSDDPVGHGQGRVQFVLSAAPAPAGEAAVSPLHEGDDDRPQLQAAHVTFTSFLARNLDGQLVGISADLPFTVDLLEVVEGGQVTLPVGFLPPGTYDQLVVVMSTVELITANGTSIVITPPGGGFTAIVSVRAPFVVTEGQTTTIALKFRWWSAFRWVDGSFRFHPEFDCEVD